MLKIWLALALLVGAGIVCSSGCKGGDGKPVVTSPDVSNLPVQALQAPNMQGSGSDTAGGAPAAGTIDAAPVD